jgi:hypothetical protein
MAPDAADECFLDVGTRQVFVVARLDRALADLRDVVLAVSGGI